MGLFKRDRRKNHLGIENDKADEHKEFSLSEENEDLKEHTAEDDFWPPFVKKPKL